MPEKSMREMNTLELRRFLNWERTLFGTDRMLRSLNAVQQQDPVGIPRAVTADVETFGSGAPQFDDLTMFCAHYIGKE